MATEDTNSLIEQRKAKLTALRAKGIDPFKNKFTPTETCANARANYTEGREVALAGRFVGVSLVVRDVKKAWKELTAQGVLFDGPPQTQSWGGLICQLKDPAGNVLTLLQFPPRKTRKP